MSSKVNHTEWSVLGSSVRGPSHERSGLPNQDAIHWELENQNSVVIAAVADGHGSAKYVRSGDGSRLAVKTALSILRSLITDENAMEAVLSDKQRAEERIGRQLAAEWTNAVADDLRDRPLSKSELKMLVERAGVVEARELILNPLDAYGSTILAIAVTPSLAIFLQLGDGDIVTVSSDREASMAFPKEKQLGNETFSLCMDGAWRYCRVSFQITSDPGEPALILLSTDGYANSFKSDKDFLKAGSDILKLLQTDGIAYVEDRIEAWLANSSKTSGDDTTMAILHRHSPERRPERREGRRETRRLIRLPFRHRVIWP